MRYLFVNAVSGFGSTGRLVAEKARELMQQGNECCIAYGREEFGHSDIPSYCIGGRMNSVCHAVETRILDNHGFSSRLATARFLSWVRKYDPDVIWLHNIHGYYLHVGMLFSYLKTCGKEICWTLHDCWAFTGHCSHFDYVKCSRWKTGCFDCPQKSEYPESLLLDNSKRNYERKKAAFTGVPNMQIIVPSHWLTNLVHSSFLAEYPVSVEYHKVDRAVFHPVESNFRERIGIGNAKMILSVSSIWDSRKGYEDILRLSELLNEDEKLVLIGLAESQLEALPKHIIGLPRTANIQELAEAYSAADVYVSASYEETFGMTVLEAAECGTTPVVYEGTAAAEIAVQHGGVTVPVGAENLLVGIRKVLYG